MDRRQRKTRKAIFDAFAKLLENKSYSNITVQEIIDEADISRSTFYSHFETKDELLRELCNEIFEHVFSDHISYRKESRHEQSEYLLSPDKIPRNQGFRYYENAQSVSHNLTKEKTHDFSHADNDLKDEITHLLYHLKDSSQYISRILFCESGEMFMNYFKEYLEKIFSDELKKIRTDIPKEYILNHMVCDFAETVRWWMKNDKYSPEDISRFFFSTTPFC